MHCIALLETYFEYSTISLKRWIHILGSPVNHPASPCLNWHPDSTEFFRQKNSCWVLVSLHWAICFHEAVLVLFFFA